MIDALIGQIEKTIISLSPENPKYIEHANALAKLYKVKQLERLNNFLQNYGQPFINQLMRELPLLRGAIDRIR